MYSGLGMNFGHRSTNWSEPGLTASLTEIYNAGGRKLRLNLPAYTTETADTTYRDQIRLQATTALAMGFTKVVLGYSVSGAASLTNTTMTGAYRTNILAYATWIATLPEADQRKIELMIANEDDSRIDGTTVTASQFRVYMKDTLAVDAKAICTFSDVSIGVRNDFIGAWISAGRGSLDKIAENLYKPQGTFTSHVSALVAAFGRDHCYISEFGYIDETAGYDWYVGDDEYFAREAWWQMNECRKYGIDCYFFLYDTGLPSVFALKQADGSLRSAWYSMTAQREDYISVTTPR